MWLDRIAARLGYTKAAGIPAPGFLRAGLSEWSAEIPDYSIVRNQAELYQRLSWVHIAVTIVAQTAAGTRLAVKTLQNEKTTEITNHPFELLLNHPNPLQSRFEFLEATFGYRALTGNCYWWLNRPRRAVAHPALPDQARARW